MRREEDADGVGIIRVAVADDLPAIETIVRDAYAVYVPRIGREPAPMSADYAALIAAGHVHVLADENAVRGLVVLLSQDDALLLENIAVAPESHGRGFGKRLLLFTEQVARDRGLSAVRLYTNAAMTENIALYTRAGYVETHRVGEHGFRRVYMLKRLP